MQHVITPLPFIRIHASFIQIHSYLDKAIQYEEMTLLLAHRLVIKGATLHQRSNVLPVVEAIPFPNEC